MERTSSAHYMERSLGVYWTLYKVVKLEGTICQIERTPSGRTIGHQVSIGRNAKWCNLRELSGSKGEHQVVKWQFNIFQPRWMAQCNINIREIITWDKSARINVVMHHNQWGTLQSNITLRKIKMKENL